MDTTLAAGWIAFWGAIAGALIGGLLTALASWATTKRQWDAERVELRRGHLDDAVTDMHGQAVLAGFGSVSAEGMHYVDWLRLLASIQAVAARSNFDSPALSAVTDALFDRLKPKGIAVQAESPVRGTEETSRDLLTLANAASIWLADPKAFEARRPTLDDLWNGEYAKSFGRPHVPPGTATRTEP